MHDEVINPRLLMGSNEDVHVPAAVVEGRANFAQCTRCDYCPKRDRADAFERIFAHASRCHGPDQAEAIIAEVKMKFAGRKKFKSPENTCEKCGQTVRGSRKNVLDHQNRSNCVKSEDVDSPSTSAGPSKRRKVSKK